MKKFKPNRDFYTPKKYPVKETIIGAICRVFEILPEDLTGKTRKREVIYARHLLRYCYRLKNIPFEKIGVKFDCDHATVIHSVRTCKNLMETDKDYKFKCNQIINKLNLIKL